MRSSMREFVQPRRNQMRMGPGTCPGALMLYVTPVKARCILVQSIPQLLALSAEA